MFDGRSVLSFRRIFKRGAGLFLRTLNGVKEDVRTNRVTGLVSFALSFLWGLHHFLRPLRASMIVKDRVRCTLCLPIRTQPTRIRRTYRVVRTRVQVLRVNGRRFLRYFGREFVYLYRYRATHLRGKEVSGEDP